MQAEDNDMRIDLVAGTSNVVRFPVERRARPTLDLLREIAPDVREVLQLVESFDVTAPDPNVRHSADAEAADYVLNHVRAEPGEPRREALKSLLASVVVRAVEACLAAHDASVAASRAHQRVIDAQTEGRYWLLPLEQRAEALTSAAAQLILDAHIRSEEAEGAARAIGMAMRGETWIPFNLQTEAEALFFGQTARRAG
jgi:hypothetical protein